MQRKQNQNKVNEPKTVEKIASWFSDFIYSDLGENSSPWTKFDPLTANLFFEFTILAVCT